jgi:integrase
MARTMQGMARVRSGQAMALADPRNDFREFRKLLARAGLPPVRLHDLRHTAASLLLAQHVPARVVMEILGHSQIALTMNTYSHVAPEVSREAADRMARALWHDEGQVQTGEQGNQ